jgi:hypothetical protein
VFECAATLRIGEVSRVGSACSRGWLDRYRTRERVGGVPELDIDRVP